MEARATMTPEKLSQWIYKIVPGGRTLVLAHDQAVGQPLVVATWTREDVDEAQENNRSMGAQVLDAAQDHADSVGEGCRFTLQWRSDVGATLRAIIHRAAPQDRPANEHALHAEFVSPNAMIGQLLSHISQQQRVINGSIGAVLSAYERALVMQQKTMESQASMLLAYRDEPRSHVAGAADEALLTLKADALRKLVEFGPEIAKMAVTAFAARGLKSDDDEDDDNEGPQLENGQAQVS
jgi:hypothetical protein